MSFVIKSKTKLGDYTGGYEFAAEYLAATDIFVVAYSSGISGALLGYCGSTLSNFNVVTTNGPGNVSENRGICFPVKKGRYWKVVCSGTSAGSISCIKLY